MTETIAIEGMHCGGCVASVKRAIERLSVTSVNVTIGSATVEFDESAVTHSQIVEAIEDAGYEVPSPPDGR